MKKWSEEAWEAALPDYEGILRQPFIRELADGTLSSERFRFYIGQDSLYIADYSRVLSHIASRLADTEQAAAFIGFAADGVAVEKALHSQYLHGEIPARKTNACLLYTSWLKAHAYEPVEVAAAAILPCFRVYKEVGMHIVATSAESNPYKAWIDCYSDPVFEKSNNLAIDICDVLASATTPEIRRRMTDAFVQATRMEHLFWESAYNLDSKQI